MMFKIRLIEEKDNLEIEKIIRDCLIEYGANHEGTAWADEYLCRLSFVYSEPKTAYYVAVDENENIVGLIDLRHTLNDFLKDFGNSGYSVRPSERRKGYATEMLRQILLIAKQAGLDEVHLSVERDNEPSVKTIVKNGGKYERSFEFEGEEADIYKIVL